MDILEIKDLEKLAKKRVPKMFFDYVNSGSWTETTYNENVSDYSKIKLRQRVAVDMTNRKLNTKLVDQDVSMPVAIAPTGLTGMQRADGEILAAQACEEFGIPYTLSTMSVCSIEEVAKHTKKPFWFQLYVMRDKKFMERLIERADKAGCSALVLTLDLQILGQRHKDIRNGLSTPPKFTPKHIYQMVTRPKWCFEMLQTKNRSFGNIVGHVDGVSDLRSLGSWTSEQFDPKLDWNEIEWIRKKWKKKLILKGILDSEDAIIASKTGADAIIVSNHGGRQLDGSRAPFDQLAEIVDAVGDKLDVICEGGIHRGTHMLKALSLGAKACSGGRLYLYALAAGGQAGVERAIEKYKAELVRDMKLMGCTKISDLNRNNLRFR